MSAGKKKMEKAWYVCWCKQRRRTIGGCSCSINSNEDVERREGQVGCGGEYATITRHLVKVWAKSMNNTLKHVRFQFIKVHLCLLASGDYRGYKPLPDVGHFFYYMRPSNLGQLNNYLWFDGPVFLYSGIILKVYWFPEYFTRKEDEKYFIPHI